MTKSVITLVVMTLSLITSSSIEAQDRKRQDTLGVFVQDGWIEKMDKYASYKAAMTNDIEVFTVDTKTNDIELYPNTSSFLRLSFNYAFISLNFKFAPSFFPGNGNDEKEKGETKSISFGADFTFKHWVQSLHYYTGKGYYLNNTKDYEPGWEKGDPYIQFPELRYFCIQGSTGYSFNEKFSVKSLTTQTERQVKNAGTFLPMLAYRYYIINNDEELSASVTSTQKSNNFEVSLGAGYYYTFVVKRDFYFSIGATPSIGMLFMKLYTRTPGNTEVSRQQDPLFRLDSRVALGYNGVRFFTGVLINATSTAFEQENTQVINSNARMNYQLHVGYRFQAPKKLRDKVGYVLDAGKKQ